MYTSMFQIFFWRKKYFFMIGSKGFVSHFYNHNTNSYNKFEFYKINVFFFFKIMLKSCYNCQKFNKSFLNWTLNRYVSYECHTNQCGV